MSNYDDQMIELETREMWLNQGECFKRNGGRP